MAASWFRQPSILPGFGLTLGFTTFFLSALVLLPLAALVYKTTSMTWADFIGTVLDERALASYRLSFGAAFIAAVINAFFGFIVAWSLVRYEFPGRRLVDALIDLPFALPTAVSGIALATVFSPTGWLGVKLQEMFGAAGRVHVDRRGGRADPDRAAVRRALRAAGPGRGATRPRGGGRDARRRTVHGVPPDRPAGSDAGAGHWLHDGVRAWRRRVRLGRVHLGQPAAEDRDHAAADRDQARAVRLQRRCRTRLHDAAGVVPDAARDQPGAGLEPPSSVGRINPVASRARARPRTKGGC